MRTMTIAVAFSALLFLVAGWKNTGRDWESSYRYAHQAAKKYRHQRDHIQALLTRRVVENRRLAAHITRLHHQMIHRADVREAIRLASVAYRVDYSLLYRIANCESWLNPNAKNRHSSASGLFQFLTGTFAGTPYGRESIWSPYANALAAGWMISNGRRGEWVC